VVATPEAAEIIRSLAPGSSTVVVPNGVDTQFFGSPLRPGKALTVVLNTSLNNEASVRDAMDFCRAILPAVRARIPHVRFLLTSREAPMAAAAHLPGAEVSAPCTDLRLLLHSQAVAAAPLRAGSDVWTTVLEPMAAGVPVVTTSKVRDRLGAHVGRDLQVADEPMGFAMQLVGLLTDASARAALGGRGRAFVAEHHAWSVTAGRLVEIVESVVQPRRPALGVDAGSGTAVYPRA
jgi:glycosyltransferase involved in cell wall biosynthesis